MAKEKGAGGGKPDLATLAGLLVAIGGIVGGLILEGGEIKDISQYTAAVIVLGGTLGAVMVNCTPATLIGGIRRMGSVFFDTGHGTAALMEEIVQYAGKARKSGIVSLEQDAAAIKDPFLRKALNLAVDGTDMQEIRKMLELDIEMIEHSIEAEAKVFESAGGYAPTIGIIGAVMGLIQVMKNLTNIEQVGHGIAVAFVATVYGVAIANILFLPMANKIKARGHDEIRQKLMILEGVIAIVEGLNPKLIRSKLEGFCHGAATEKSGGAKKAGAPAPAEG